MFTDSLKLAGIGLSIPNAALHGCSGLGHENYIQYMAHMLSLHET